MRLGLRIRGFTGAIGKVYFFAGETKTPLPVRIKRLPAGIATPIPEF
jgi:hypothetical protein